MGGLLHLFDPNQSSMARKIYTQKHREVDGLEAPRNSLELPAETSESYAIEDCIPYSYQVKEEISDYNRYPTVSSMKKLIKEEILKRPSTRNSAPSIVARLMGVDTIPLDTKSVILEHENWRKDLSERISIAHSPCTSNIYSEIYGHQRRKENHDERHRTWRSESLRPREHPQEEELQKFKKDFEAWQAARIMECSRKLEVENIPRHLLSHVKLNYEKVTLANSGKTASNKTNSRLVKSFSNERDDSFSNERDDSQSKSRGNKKDLFQVDHYRESLRSRNRTMSMDFERLPLMQDEFKINKSSAPSRIVVLKPGPDGIKNYEEPCASSSGISEERASIEDFLEEVKERLKYELQGKNLRRGSAVRGAGIETPFSEKQSDPKEIARNIAKHVRESVTRDSGINLIRSESTRSYRSEVHLDETRSPDFINRDTRRFLSERLVNVLKKETDLEIPKAVGRGTSVSMHEDGRSRLEHKRQVSRTGIEMQIGSFRHGLDDTGMLHREFSPRNLVRSLSAPVSGTSFGKLLLEDRHILTGAQIRRKQEASESVAKVGRRQKKDKFRFREKVSNFRYNFSFRGKLFFGKRIQSVAETKSDERDLLDDMMGGPTVVLNPCDRQDNSTEVPPSPASVCSSSCEEAWGSIDCLSQLSTADSSAVEDHNLPQVFREISSNLSELRRQLNELECDGVKEALAGDASLETEIVESSDRAKAYVRDLLITSGLYSKSSDRTMSRWDPLAKPISKRIFEEVEESYRKSERGGERHTNACSEEVDHKLLLDLLNEALSGVLGPPVRLSIFKTKASSRSMSQPPYGRTLLDHVWRIMCKQLYPSADGSNYLLDNLIAQDMSSTPWTGLVSDEAGGLGREMECLIFSDLIEEMVKEIEL